MGISIETQFILPFVLGHITDHHLFSCFQTAEHLDVVVVAFAEAHLSGLEKVVVHNKQRVIARTTVERAVADAQHVILDASNDKNLRLQA